MLRLPWSPSPGLGKAEGCREDKLHCSSHGEAPPLCPGCPCVCQDLEQQMSCISFWAGCWQWPTDPWLSCLWSWALLPVWTLSPACCFGPFSNHCPTGCSNKRCACSLLQSWDSWNADTVQDESGTRSALTSASLWSLTSALSRVQCMSWRGLLL